MAKEPYFKPKGMATYPTQQAIIRPATSGTIANLPVGFNTIGTIPIAGTISPYEYITSYYDPMESITSRKKNEIFDTKIILLDGKPYRAVAVSGAVGDWAVYTGSIFESDERIKDYGIKLKDMDIIRKYFKTTKESEAKYRY